MTQKPTSLLATFIIQPPASQPKDCADMMAQAFDPGAVSPLPRMPLTPIPRPQVSIERLPTRRMSNKPRESMNCKSCRKRKVWEVLGQFRRNPNVSGVEHMWANVGDADQVQQAPSRLRGMPGFSVSLYIW